MLENKIEILQKEIKALKEQNHLISGFIEKSGQMVCYCNANLVFEFANSAYLNVFAKNQQDIIGQTVISVLGIEQFNKAKENIDKVLRGESVKYIEKFSANKEQYKLVEVQLIPEKSGSGEKPVKGYWVVISDINSTDFSVREVLESGVFKSLILDEYWATDLELNLIFVNKVTEKIYGFTVEERLKQKFSDRFTPESVKRVEALFRCEMEKLQKTGKSDTPFILEMEAYHKKGHSIWVELKVDFLFDSSNNFVGTYGVTREITDRKLAEQELNNERILLRTIIDNIPHAIFLKDLELRKVIANSNELESMGVNSESEAIGKNDYDIYPKETAQMFEKDDRNIIQTGQSVLNREGKIKLNSGKEKWISSSKLPLLDAEGKVKGIIGISFDITERINSQKMLYLREKALNSAANGIIITDKKGIAEWINTGFTNLTGYSENEALGKTPGDLVKSGLHDKEFYANLWDTILAGKVWKGEFINKRKNGELYDEEETISPVFDDSGEITHFIGIKNEITERKKLIKQLIISKEKAQESDNLKSAFIRNLSHEIRTPLNAIFGFSEIIRDSLQEENLKEMANLVLQSSNRLLNAVNDIMEISFIQTKQIQTHKTKFSFNSLINVIFDYYKTIYQGNLNNVNFKLIIPDDIDSLIVYSDEDKLKKSLNKLIDNAFKFTKSGEIILGYTISDLKIKLFVKDTGPGIDTKIQSHIFEYFRQGDHSLTRGYEGLGVGLPIAKGFLNELGIELELKTEIGKGSEFFMYIPIDKIKEKEKETKIELVSDRPDLTGKTILIVEDDIASQIYLQRVIERARGNVIMADNGAEGIEMVKSNKIDIILMDIRMPGMNGIEATMEIKALFPDLPIIAQTAFAMIQDREEALEAGCDDVVTKPVNRKELYQKISKLIF